MQLLPLLTTLYTTNNNERDHVWAPEKGTLPSDDGPECRCETTRWTYLIRTTNRKRCPIHS